MYSFTSLNWLLYVRFSIPPASISVPYLLIPPDSSWTTHTAIYNIFQLLSCLSKLNFLRSPILYHCHCHNTTVNERRNNKYVIDKFVPEPSNEFTGTNSMAYPTSQSHANHTASVSNSGSQPVIWTNRQTAERIVSLAKWPFRLRSVRRGEANVFCQISILDLHPSFSSCSLVICEMCRQRWIRDAFR